MASRKKAVNISFVDTEKEEKLSIRIRILDAAAKVFITQGFGNARISHIIQMAGVSRSSMYDNFKGKEDLVIALNDRLTEEGAELTRKILIESESAAEGIRQWLRGTLHLPERYRNLVKIMHQDHEAPNALLDKKATLAKFRTGQKWIRQALRRGIDDGEFRANLNVNQTAQALQNFHHIFGLVRAQDYPLIDFLGEDGDLAVELIIEGLLKKA